MARRNVLFVSRAGIRTKMGRVRVKNVRQAPSSPSLVKQLALNAAMEPILWPLAAIPARPVVLGHSKQMRDQPHAKSAPPVRIKRNLPRPVVCPAKLGRIQALLLPSLNASSATQAHTNPTVDQKSAWNVLRARIKVSRAERTAVYVRLER